MTYYQNLTFEKVEVIAHYKDTGMDILKFKWKDTVYKVDKMADKWKIPQGEKLSTHFTVICETQGIIAELRYDNIDMKWELIQWDNL